MSTSRPIPCTVNALQRRMDYNVEVGDVFEECREYLDGRPDLAVYFVKRQANKCAHLIARAPCMVNCHNIFMSPPLFLLETLLYDARLS